MPHIATQISRRSVAPSKPALRRTSECHDFDRPEMYQRQKSNSNQRAEHTNLLVSIPNSKRGEFGSIRHIQDPTSPCITSPLTAVGPVFSPMSPYATTPNTACDSVFELPSTFPAESPSSSVGSPESFYRSPLSDTSPKAPMATSFVAELEDTSVLVVAQCSVPQSTSASTPDEPGYIDQLKEQEFSKRAKAAIQNIIAIETSNRLLLERAIAAEEATQHLKQKTESLQHRIDYCSHIHRPQTAPPKPARIKSTPIVLSSFNKASLKAQGSQPPPILQAGPLSAVERNQNPLPPLPTSKSGPSGKTRPLPRFRNTIQAPHVSKDSFYPLNPPCSPRAIPPAPTTHSGPPPSPSTRRRPAPLDLTTALMPSPLFTNDDPSKTTFTQSPTAQTPHRRTPQSLSSPLKSPVPSSAASPFATISFPVRARQRRPPLRISQSQSNLATAYDSQKEHERRNRAMYAGQSTAEPIPKPLPMNVRVDLSERDDQTESGKRKGLRSFMSWGKRAQSF